MKKLVIFIFVVTTTFCTYASINVTNNDERNSVYVEKNINSTDWEPWETISRAYAYYHSGKRFDETNMDLIKIPIERRVSNGYVEYRAKVMGKWYSVRKSNIKGYTHCFDAGRYVYYFNM